MAEFCLDCWNRMNGTSYTERDVVTDMDFCEGCEQWKPVIVVTRWRGPAGWLEGLYRRMEDWAWDQRHGRRR